MKKYLWGFLLLVLAFSCDSKKSAEDSFDQLAQSDTAGQINQASSELASQVIKSIPPPVEMSSIIKELGASYENEILNPSENKDKYNTNYLKAINLGVYGADLGYINIYNHKQDAITYLDVVVKLAEDLKVGQFFDFETIKRLASNSNSLDSMLNITQSNFDKMNTYLQDQKRSNLSMYMLTGGWIEALYIANQVSEDQKSTALVQKIGEQKIVLDQIMLLFSFYKSDPNAVMLEKELAQLKKLFDQVKIEKVYAEPTMVEVNGALEVQENSKLEVIITPEIAAQIAAQTKLIRNKIIG